MGDALQDYALQSKDWNKMKYALSGYWSKECKMES